ncbi:MAG TPA: hypothetical protein DCE41_08745 [Cytophagales bacterium]|nr:hypothetical protein [Cytophagales bacterium]HAA19287.1 hypothetical protein [Cytophagales bacterium]HAP61187.1 hypothetical protein [Cytophagales bacterium]
MRVLGDIPHKKFKVTLFGWNGKYLLKFELGSLEQTYKLDELDYTDEEVKGLVADSEFMDAVGATFNSMGASLGQALSQL